MKFNKKQKEVIQQALQNLTVASRQLFDLKQEFYDNRERNDQYYGLEDIEVRVDGAISDLESCVETKGCKTAL